MVAPIAGTPLETIHVRPRLGNWFWYLLTGLLLAIFAALPALYLFDGHPVAKVAVGVAAFAGLWYAASLLDWRRTLTLSPAGITLQREPGSKWLGNERPALLDGSAGGRELFWTLGSGGGRSGVIPWEDVTQVGIFKFRGRRIVGVGVGSVERFLASQPPEPEPSRFEQRITPVLEPIWRAFRFLLGVMSLVSGGEGDGIFPDEEDDAPEAPKQAALRQRLAVNRENWGYEFVFRYTDRDRSATKFAELLRSYWTQVRAQQVQDVTAPYGSGPAEQN
jgi:hypothetical protein